MMFRIPVILNRTKLVSNVLLNQGSGLAARPLSVSAVRFTPEEIAKKSEQHDIDALFDDESNRQPESRARRGHRGGVSINRIELLGGVADDPMDHAGRRGGDCVTFNMFTNSEYRRPDGTYDENVELHKITVFGTWCPFVRRNIKKGSRVLVTGRLHYFSGAFDQRVPRSSTIISDVIQVIAKTSSKTQESQDSDDQIQ